MLCDMPQTKPLSVLPPPSARPLETPEPPSSTEFFVVAANIYLYCTRTRSRTSPTIPALRPEAPAARFNTVRVSLASIWHSAGGLNQRVKVSDVLVAVPLYRSTGSALRCLIRRKYFCVDLKFGHVLYNTYIHKCRDESGRRLGFESWQRGGFWSLFLLLLLLLLSSVFFGM